MWKLLLLIPMYYNVGTRSRYQGQGQVITSHRICGMKLLVPALDACFWHNTPHMGLTHMCGNSSTLAMELLQSFDKPLICIRLCCQKQVPRVWISNQCTWKTFNDSSDICLMGYIHSIQNCETSHQTFGPSHRKCPMCQMIFMNTE